MVGVGGGGGGVCGWVCVGVCVLLFERTDGRTDGRTVGRTDGRTDGRNRNLITHLCSATKHENVIVSDLLLKVLPSLQFSGPLCRGGRASAIPHLCVCCSVLSSPTLCSQAPRPSVWGLWPVSCPGGFGSRRDLTYANSATKHGDDTESIRCPAFHTFGFTLCMLLKRFRQLFLSVAY